MADWSSLPSELVRRIADCLLSTNELDCYMDFRAVCPSWRSATDDPTNSSDLRFRPIHWIIIDEVFQTDARLLVNTATGRVVRKDLPLLRRFYVVATTYGGFFILADREAPHAARVLNPFTGQMIYFTASVPSSIDISAATLGGDPVPNLVLLSDRSYERHTASVDSDVFTADSNKPVYLFMRRLLSGGAFCGADNAYPVSVSQCVNNIAALTKMFDIDPVIGLGDYVGQGHGNSCFVVRSGGQVLVVVMLKHKLKVFNATTTYSDEPEPVKSLGHHAIFVGNCRCVCVSADKLPSVVANCIYYVKNTSSSLNIYKYDLEVEKEEMVSAAIDYLDPVTLSCANYPLTIVQLLSSYTINVRVSQLPKEEVQLPGWFDSMFENLDGILDGMNFDYLAEIPDDDDDVISLSAGEH